MPPPLQNASYNLKGKGIYSLEVTEHYIYASAGKDGLFRRVIPSVTNEWQDISSDWEYLGFSAIGTNLGVRDVHVPPGQEIILYTALANNDTGLTAVNKSTNGGSDWFASDSGLGIEQPRNSSLLYRDAAVLLSSPLSPNTVYTTSRHGLSIFRTRDGGGFWETIIKNEDPELVPSTISRVLTFAYHPARPNELWAGGMQSGQFDSVPIFFRSVDSGDSWQSVRLGTISDNAVWSIAIEGTSGNIYAGLGGLVIISEDEGTNWTNILNSGRSDDRIQVVIDPNRNSHLIAGGGTTLFESQDGGMTWQELVSPAASVSTLTWEGTTGNVYVGTDNSGVYVKAF
jgi:photosystem II stability/assembly factor-like uncharacterized protein